VTALHALFHPRAIAIVGASDDPVKIGGRPLAFLLRHGYRGRVFPVNPARTMVQGLTAFPSLAAIPEAVDVAVVVLPAERVLDSLEACAAKGVRVAIVFSSGFAEVGETGRREQALMRELAARSGMRIMGPNCQGFAHLPSRLVTTFASPFLDEGLEIGPIAMVSQSGAMAGMIYEMGRAAGLGLNYWVSTGNEADVQAAEILAEVVEDPETRVALCYLEDIKDAGRFREALGRAHQRGVPVFVLKSGRSAAGRRAASSHTGALAGEDEVYDAVFREWGAIRCGDPADLLRLPQAFLHYDEAGPRVAVLSNSGGLGVLSVDLCAEVGLEVAEFTKETVRGLSAALPDFAAAANPVDLTAQILSDPGMLMRVLPLLEADPGVDMIVFQIALFGAATDVDRFAREVAGIAKSTRKVVAVSCPQRRVVESFRAAGVLAFDDGTTALRSLGCLAYATKRRARWLARTTGSVAAPPAPPARHPMRQSPEGFLNEWESRRLIGSFGLPLVETRFVTVADLAPPAAEELGFPVVLKVCSADLPHKSDAGGVVVGLGDAAAVAKAARHMEAEVRRQAPAAALEGFLVQHQAPGGLELALGVKVDSVFGPVVMVGSGGALIEALRDFRLLLPPVDPAGAEEALRALRIGPLWDGARGQPPFDLPAAVELVVKLGEAARALAGSVEEIDLNPVRIGRSGQGALVLDALVRVPR
jgi:acetate---CoA ligase (ADP-forming)